RPGKPFCRSEVFLRSTEQRGDENGSSCVAKGFPRRRRTAGLFVESRREMRHPISIGKFRHRPHPCGGGDSPRDSVSGCGCERSSGRNRAGASSPDEPSIGGIVSGNHSENSLSLANLLRLASGKVVSPFVAILYPLCPVYPFGGPDHSASTAASRFDPSLRSVRCGPAEGTGMGLQAVYGHHGLFRPRFLGPSAIGPVPGTGGSGAEGIDSTRGG